MTDLAAELAIRTQMGDAGIPVLSVTPSGATYFDFATQAQRDQGDALLAAFDWTMTAAKQAAATAKANEQTIGGALDAALQSNQTAISQLVAWVAANPGTLTTAQLSAAMRTAANNQVAQFRQLNGLVRLVRRNLSTADLNSALKG